MECGGSEKYVSLLSNNINTQKFAVTLAVLNNAHSFYTINSSGIELVDLKVKHARNSIFKILALVKSKRPDIIFSTSNHLNLYLALFKWLLPEKTIIIARESSVVSINSKRAKFPAFYSWLIKKYYPRFNFIICQSKYMQQDLIAHFNIKTENTVVINNPVEEIHLLSKEPVYNKFISIARLSEEKGIDRLIRAVANLTTSFTFHIIGDGEKKDALQNLINSLQLQNKVFMEEKRDQPFEGMEDAGFFLMGSHYEGFPNTLLEAGTLGIPVIAFDAPGGIREIVIDGENGLLVKDIDEKAFARTIEKAMGTNFNRAQIKEHTIKSFPVIYLITKTENLFMGLYEMDKKKQAYSKTTFSK